MCLRSTACLLVAALALAGLSNGQTIYSLETLAGSDEVGDGGPAANALLTHLQGVVCDAKGNIYLADADDHRIRKISPDGLISTAAGTGHAGFSGDGGPATAAQINTPYGLAFDRAGNLYIADLGNRRIRRIDASGRILTIAGGGSVAGAAADGRAAIDAALDSPRNIVADAGGGIYFSDFGANRVYYVTPAGKLLHIAGTGDAGFSGDRGGALFAELSSPAGLAIDSLGALYIADAGNGRIRRVFNGVIESFGNDGKPYDATPVGPRLPIGLAFDADGGLFIAQGAGDEMLHVTADAIVTTIPQVARDVAVGPGGDVFVVANSCLYRLFRDGGVITVAGESPSGHLGDGGAAAKARFSRPSAVARDASGNLYVADTGNNRIRKILADLTVVTIAGDDRADPLSAPAGIAVDSSGVVFFSDTGNNRVRKIDAAGTISTVAGTGQAGFAGDGGSALAAQLNAPAALAFDSDDNLYIADANNHAIRMVTSAGVISTVAGTGQRGFSGDGGLPGAARLNSPRGVAIGPTGAIFIADTGNGRVRRVIPATAFGPAVISTVPNPNSIWRAPTGIAVDSSGNLFLTDRDDQRVYQIEPNGRLTPIAGTGAAGFSGESGPAIDLRLANPTGLIATGDGALYLCDTDNHRIGKLIPDAGGVVPPPAQSAPAVVNAASLLPGAIAPGEIVSIFGDRIGPENETTADLTSMAAPLELGGVQVLVSGHPAPLFYAGPNQINLQVPYSLTGRDAAEIQIVARETIVSTVTVQIAPAAPGIFTTGTSGQAAALNEDTSLNSPDNPAARGSIIVLFATGAGATDPVTEEGKASSSPAPALVQSVSVRVGGYPAEIDYARAAPGLVGVLQINARVPGGFMPPGILPVTLQIGDATSQPGVFVAVK